MVMVIGRQHEANFFMEIQKRIEFLMMEGDLVYEQNQDNKLKESSMLAIIPDWIACESWSEECWRC
jgi:hypothetical protein